MVNGKWFHLFQLIKIKQLIVISGFAVLLLLYHIQFNVLKTNEERQGSNAFLNIFNWIQNIPIFNDDRFRTAQKVDLLSELKENDMDITTYMIPPWWEDENLLICHQHVKYSKTLQETIANDSQTVQTPSKERAMPMRKYTEYVNYTFRLAAGGSCGFRAYQQGDNQSIISYTLYGNKEMYTKGFSEILNDAGELYPNWLVRIYTDPRERKDLLCPLLIEHSNLFICDIINLPFPLGNKRLWRVAPLGDRQVIRFASRDSDSKVSGNISLKLSTHLHEIRMNLIEVGLWLNTYFNMPVMIFVRYCNDHHL